MLPDTSAAYTIVGSTQHAGCSPGHTAPPHPSPEANILYRWPGGQPVTNRHPVLCRGMMPFLSPGGSRVETGSNGVLANMHSGHVCPLTLDLYAAFQWFLTAFSVRPSSFLVMRAQWLPRMECHLHSSSSSDTSQLPFLAAGLGGDREGRGGKEGCYWKDLQSFTAG